MSDNPEIPDWVRKMEDASLLGTGRIPPPNRPIDPPPFTRDPGLVRAEFIDALRDYAQVWRDKARMEEQRAEAVEAIAVKIEAGESADFGDAEMTAAWQQAYNLLELRWRELKLRVERLCLEHGNN